MRHWLCGQLHVMVSARNHRPGNGAGWLTKSQVPRPQPLHCGVHAPRRVAATTETGILSQTPAAAKWCKLSRLLIHHRPLPRPHLTSGLCSSTSTHLVNTSSSWQPLSTVHHRLPPTLHLPFPPLHALGSVNFRFAATSDAASSASIRAP